MAKIITITNQKGGVGKTTTALALISGLHKKGKKVLGIDLDPQGNLGFSLGVNIEENLSIYDVFRNKATIEEATIKTQFGDVVISNILLSSAELEFNFAGREFMLRDKIEKIKEDYDYIIIDTPPALNVLTVNAYTSSDSIIIPMVPEILSLLGISQLRDTVGTVKKYYNPSLTISGILLTKFNKRTNLAREVYEMAQSIADDLDTKVFKSKIRTGVSVAESPAHGESIIDYAPKSKPSQDYLDLINEVLGE